MLIYLADLAHTYSTKNESLMIPLNIGYLKAYALEQHKDKVEIKLFKDPQKLLEALDYTPSSGEIIVSNKNFKKIGSIKIDY